MKKRSKTAKKGSFWGYFNCASLKAPIRIRFFLLLSCRTHRAGHFDTKYSCYQPRESGEKKSSPPEKKSFDRLPWIKPNIHHDVSVATHHHLVVNRYKLLSRFPWELPRARALFHYPLQWRLDDGFQGISGHASLISRFPRNHNTEQPGSLTGNLSDVSLTR